MEIGNINHIILPFISELQIAEESWESYLSGDKSLMTGMDIFFEYFVMPNKSNYQGINMQNVPDVMWFLLSLLQIFLLDS